MIFVLLILKVNIEKKLKWYPISAVESPKIPMGNLCSCCCDGEEKCESGADTEEGDVSSRTVEVILWRFAFSSCF